MTHGKTLAFHSYKGGTGKTTLIANLAALYAMNGLKVCLLDFDLNAPSLTTYFRKKPVVYLNDLLKGSLDKPKGEIDVSLSLVDVSSELGLKGQLLLGFSSPKKEDIEEIELQHEQKWKESFRRFQSAKNRLFEEYEIDYLFLDTSPGMRLWSINALISANMFFLIMKINDMDIEGTKNTIKDIYDLLTGYGKSKYYIILNKTPGASPLSELGPKADENSWEKEVESEVGTKVIGSVPCFCDVQFNRHEFLTVINQPEHVFSKKVVRIAEKIRGLS